MKIKICGLFRSEDIDYVNDARPDYMGFVFAESKRKITSAQAARLKERLARDITAVGVFVNAPIDEITALYREGIISIAQLHGNEDETYIMNLKEASGIKKEPIPVIKVFFPPFSSINDSIQTGADYFLFDSGAGTGIPFNWNTLNQHTFSKPWFLAGGINGDNIKQAMALKPYCIDVSGGAETGGIKDREKILQLTEIVRYDKT